MTVCAWIRSDEDLSSDGGHLMAGSRWDIDDRESSRREFYDGKVKSKATSAASVTAPAELDSSDKPISAKRRFAFFELLALAALWAVPWSSSSAPMPEIFSYRANDLVALRQGDFDGSDGTQNIITYTIAATGGEDHRVPETVIWHPCIISSAQFSKT